MDDMCIEVLPATGAGIATIVVIAIGLTLAGVAALFVTRRRSTVVVVVLLAVAAVATSPSAVDADSPDCPPTTSTITPSTTTTSTPSTTTTSTTSTTSPPTTTAPSTSTTSPPTTTSTTTSTTSTTTSTTTTSTTTTTTLASAPPEGNEGQFVFVFTGASSGSVLDAFSFVGDPPGEVTRVWRQTASPGEWPVDLPIGAPGAITNTGGVYCGELTVQAGGSFTFAREPGVSGSCFIRIELTNTAGSSSSAIFFNP